MSPRAKFRVIPPREAKPAKPKKPKAELRHIEHVRFGIGRVLVIRAIDGSEGGYKADVKFADGTVRTLLLIQRFWLTDITSLIPQLPKLRRPVKAEQQPVAVKTELQLPEDGECTQLLQTAA